VDHRSFRDALIFSIGFVIERNRALLRRLLKEHVTDDTRHQLAKKVVEHLELSGFEIDESEQVMRKTIAGAAGSSLPLPPLLLVKPLQPFQRQPLLRRSRSDLAQLRGHVEFALGFGGLLLQVLAVTRHAQKG
jgi:hypothetical protein